MSETKPTNLERAIGKHDPFMLLTFHQGVSKIADSWAEVAAPSSLTVAAIRKRLRQTAATRARDSRAWLKNSLFHRRQIYLAGYILENPDADENDLSAAIDDSDDFARFDAHMSFDFKQSIELVMKRLDDYKKKEVRKRVVEPFYNLLKETDIVPSRKCPFNKIMEAVFDEVGVELKDRPKPGVLRSIVYDLAHPGKRPKSKKPQWPKRTKRRQLRRAAV